MKTNAIIRIILFSLAIMILGSILLGVVAYDTFSFSSRTESDEHTILHGTMYSGDPKVIKNIKINWAAGSITIVPGQEKNITVTESEVENERYVMQISEIGSTVTIDYCEDMDSLVGIGKKSPDAKDLVIYVPAHWECTSLEIDAASAAVEVRDLTIGEVDFDGASALCSFENCVINDLEVDTASGDVTFSGTLRQLSFDAMSASFTGKFDNVPDRMDVDTVSGDLDIFLPEKCGFDVRMNALSSDFSSEFNVTQEADSYIYGDRHCRISVNAMSGDVNIHKNIGK